MSFEHGAGFRICGAVVRRFVPKSNKIAFVTLDVVSHPRSKKIELRAFDRGLVEEISQLGAGMTIQVTGSVDVEPVKDKAGKEVKVDGYEKWVPVLTIRALTVEGASRAPSPAQTPADTNGTAPPPASPGASWTDDDVNF